MGLTVEMRRKKNSQIEHTLTRLGQELRSAYQVAGKELSEECLNEKLQLALEEIEMVYMKKELADAMHIPHTYIELGGADMTPTSSDDDQD